MWKSTYDRHKTREAAMKDLRYRRGGSSSHRRWRIRRDGEYWLVEYMDKD